MKAEVSGSADPRPKGLLAGEWQLARAFEGVDGERRGATPNLDLLRSCVLELRTGAGEKIFRDDEFAMVDLAKSLQTACGIHGIAHSGERSPSPIAHIADDRRAEMNANPHRKRRTEIGRELSFNATSASTSDAPLPRLAGMRRDRWYRDQTAP